LARIKKHSFVLQEKPSTRDMTLPSEPYSILFWLLRLGKALLARFGLSGCEANPVACGQGSPLRAFRLLQAVGCPPHPQGCQWPCNRLPL